jgi:hypothetical protein
MALVQLTAEEPSICVESPRRALVSLAQVLWLGVSKHGPFDPKLFTTEHFMDKYRRHMTRSFHTPIDESGQPHIIHAAADLLFAWECTVNKR